MNKVLLFIKIPPPYTGATLMNSYVSESKILRKNFKVDELRISYSQKVDQLGKVKLYKAWIVAKTFLLLFYKLSFNRPNLVYFQISPLGTGFLRDSLYVLLIKLFNIKLLFHLHGKGIENESNTFFKNLLYEFIFNKTQVICLSNILTYDIKNIYKGKPFILPNSIVPVNFETPIDRECYAKPKILFLSNLFISKGLMVFIEALEILQKEKVDFEGIIIGAEGDIKAEDLNKILVERVLNEKVSYLGSMYGDDKNRIIKSTDIFVFPTLNDVWGLVILEAMQFGIPVIASNEGAIPEIIEDGVTGFIVEKNNPIQIVDKVKLIINQPQATFKIRKLAFEKFHNNYTIDKFEFKLNEIIKSILN